MFRRYVRTTPRVIDRYRYVYASYRLLSSITASDKFSGYELVIGLEVHAQIKSRAKLFSRKCEITLDRRNSIDIKSYTDAWSSKYDEQANSHVDVFDAAFPGTLPVSLL